ncbi:hypothetical protein LN042_29090 [Kitasatospora sp. RB6PN24]|uniref:hypothetical protein n=1 Tax=Kitasatospora humi TaxID=2893891 RepID=UPI001E4A55B5|nr:hypothetical protein [Kitasatospora humi]MCC9311075.1 hypothetical protein [Kitasatospora humi]
MTVALLVGATTVATQSNVSAAPAAPLATYGIQHLNTQVDLPPGTWTDTPLEVVLPRSGSYELDANVRGRLDGVPPLNTYITARLWDVGAGAQVPQSARLVYQIIDYNAGNAETGGNATAPISELIRVNGPTVIRLQALRTDAVGAAKIAQIYSDYYGYTSLRYERVGP